MEESKEVKLEDLSLEKLESIAYNLYVEAKTHEQKIIAIQQNLKLVEEEIIKRKTVEIKPIIEG